MQRIDTSPMDIIVRVSLIVPVYFMVAAITATVHQLPARGFILAVALFPVYEWLRNKLFGSGNSPRSSPFY